MENAETGLGERKACRRGRGAAVSRGAEVATRCRSPSAQAGRGGQAASGAPRGARVAPLLPHAEVPSSSHPRSASGETKQHGSCSPGHFVRSRRAAAEHRALFWARRVGANQTPAQRCGPASSALSGCSLYVEALPYLCSPSAALL